MSWSINQTGKAAALKAVLATQFDIAKRGCAHIPHEQATIALIEQLVNSQLDWLEPAMVVTVIGSGSAYHSTGTIPNKGISFTLEFRPLYKFVE